MDPTFDYIVVGAGSAGCAAARRLADRGNVSVLLLEAGGSDQRREIAIPAAFSRLFRTEVDWNYATEPQAALGGRALYWPRGKVVGGSSSMNAMVWTTGHPADYDQWAAQGNPGWAWADVQPRLERLPVARGAQRSPNPLSRAFVASASRALGVAAGTPDGPTGPVAGLVQVTQHRGARASAAHAYLRNAPKSLEVRTGFHATRLTVHERRVTGLEVAAPDGTRQVLSARRGVILSAGAVNTPQLLLLSGIGPGVDLRALGLPVVTDLPGVGRNLQDHLACGIGWQCRRPLSLPGTPGPLDLLRYLLLRRGPLTSNVAEAAAFVEGTDGDPRPPLEILFGPAWFAQHGFDPRPGHYFTIGAILLRPASRGAVTLRSTDPFEAPRIDPRSFSVDSDLDRMVEGLRMVRRIAETEPLAGLRGEEVHPGGTPAGDLAAYARATAETLYHPAGTCRMGPASDPMAVVGADLRVHGVEGLQVADASIMPELVCAHPNAACMMIGERAGEQ